MKKTRLSPELQHAWAEIEAPKFPEGATRPPDDEQPASISYLWIIQPGGDDQPQRLYIGTEPGGLFQTDDGGETFELVEGLWNQSSRNNWFGGGRDHPARRLLPAHRRRPGMW